MSSLENSDGNTKELIPTNGDIEGPFYLTEAPFRAKLTPPDEGGDKIRITGRVVSTSLEPLSGAIVDIWSADSDGEYDSSSDYWYRGKVIADADGNYEFETCYPGQYLYQGSYRPAHIHIKSSAPGYIPLTTQLYFTGDPYLADNDAAAHAHSDDPMRTIDLYGDLIGSLNADGSKTWAGRFIIVLEAN